MYNLLLVDDEKSILDGLYYNIEWSELEIGDVFRASDVAGALQILSGTRIDVLITDVNMPGTDGLVLCEAVQRLYLNTKIIILSGYKSFEYAKKAIDVNVFRYVLKPVEYEVLESIVVEALSEIKQDSQKSYIIKEAKKKMEFLRPFMQSRFLNLWLERGQENPLNISEDYKDIGLDIRPNDYGFLVTITIDNWVNESVPSRIAHLAINDLATQLLCDDCRIVPYQSTTDSHTLIFLSDNAEWIRYLSKKTINQLEFLQLSILETLGCTTSIFWSFPIELTKISDVYKDISKRIKRRINYVSGGIFGPETIENQPINEIKSLQQSPSLSTLISAFQREKLMQRLEEIFIELKQPDFQTQDNILQTYHAITGSLISDSLQRNIPISQWGKDFSEFFESSNAILSIDVFQGQCFNAVHQYMDYLVSMQLSQNRKIVDKIKRMIEERISTDISVSSLSKAFNYNSNYLSRIFKLEAGVALQDYIIQVRIEKAKILLNEGERVSDVSAKVGYENLPHFSRIFKKTVGISPKQYQNI